MATVCILSNGSALELVVSDYADKHLTTERLCAKKKKKEKKKLFEL